MNNKIYLDVEIYNPLTGSSSGGDKTCDHNYPDKPNVNEAEFGTWICTKCGLKRTYEVWD